MRRQTINELECINGIEFNAFYTLRSIIADVLGPDVLEIQLIHDL